MRTIAVAVFGVLCLAGQGQAAGPPASGPAPPRIEQYVLFDGESGAARDYWNRGLSLAWRNRLGDWRDAEDRPQGTAPFAVLTPAAGNTPQRIDADVTALVKRWISAGNTGLLLRAAAGGCELASRERADEKLRPALSVVAGGRTTLCPCTADAAMSASTYKSLGGQEGLAVTRPGGTAGMRFDLSGVRGEVQKATLSLHCVKATGGTKVEVMRLDAPLLYAGGEAAKLGLARGYPRDKGIAAHGDVIFATDFADSDWREKYFTEGRVVEPTFALDPRLGSTYLRGQFVKGEVGSCALDYRWTTRQAPQPEEVYFRYYVLLEKDFGSTVDGNKMPGLAGRYGRWTGRSYSPVGGNGGSRTTGLASQSGREKVLCGWSMRGLAHKKPADANPYAHLTAVGTYAYHADQAGHFGDHWRWGTAVLERDRWYCIEQYVKVNGVDGPLDALGNGTGRRDGILRVWLDGRQVLERTDIRFRHNGAIKIDEIWLNWYHGGTQPAAATHHYRMSNVVVARSYIGPMAR